ncbi:hypothetical protein I8J31_04650 [Marinomonas sp. C1424]|uniref:Histidine kinase N-terminal 7TM region domain-containing protein n=1 Tax=Marinomonas transparens TaxID=2795388 RepID=A0A934N5E7_9GAMM|nr:hypothetical protein [Marinomonas transparens]
MTWMLPSSLALLIKCILFFYSNVHKKTYFFLFLISTFFLNLFELVAFFRIGHDLLTLKLYYCSAVFTSLYLLITCSEITKSANFTKSHLSPLIAALLSATISFTDYIISDFSILPNQSITRVAGDYYFIFQLYILFCLIFSLSLLIKNAFNQKNPHIKKHCRVALFAFIPFITMPIILIILMHLGYKVSMAGYLSLATCLMLFIFITLSDKHKLFSMMKLVPFSSERTHHLALKDLMERLSRPSVGEYVDMKSLLKEIEILVIKNTYHHTNSQKETARRLNMSESSLSRKNQKN